jgi:hypothetical protein
MMNYKSIKWGLGIVLSLGLTACNGIMPRSQYEAPNYDPLKTSKKQAMEHQAKSAQKTYASKDPTQKSTPGPVRKTAPQLPVIQ